MKIEGTHIETTDYKGRTYNRFYASKYSPKPGWFVLGKNEGYGDRLVMLCGRPDKPARAFPMRNGKMFGGWKTKRDAQRIAEEMNRLLACEQQA